MKKQLIALTLLVTLVAATVSTPVIAKANDVRKLDGSIVELNQESDEIVIVEEDIFLTESQLEELRQFSMMDRSFSSDYNTYVQKSVSKSEAIKIIEAYNKVTGMVDSSGYVIGGSTFVSSISKSYKYRNVKNFIIKYGNWGSNIVMITSYAGSKTIGKFKGEVQNAVNKMNYNDKLLFRVESATNLQDSSMCKYKLVVQKR